MFSQERDGTEMKKWREDLQMSSPSGPCAPADVSNISHVDAALKRNNPAAAVACMMSFKVSALLRNSR